MSYKKYCQGRFISADVLKWFTQEANISYSDSKTTMQGGGSIYTIRLTNYYLSYFPAEAIGKDHEVSPVLWEIRRERQIELFGL